MIDWETKSAHLITVLRAEQDRADIAARQRDSMGDSALEAEAYSRECDKVASYLTKRILRNYSGFIK